jgi:hypothetical protein
LSKKTKQKEAAEPFELSRRHIVLGLLIMIVTAGVAIAAITYFFGSSGGNSTTQIAVPQPTGPEPTAERSAAADLLASKSFADMSPDEVNLVKAAAIKAFANADFRTTSGLAPLGIDIFRIDDITRVSRLYEAGASAGGAAQLKTTLSFYCDDISGKINWYRYVITADASSAARPAQITKEQVPFNNTLSGLDWSQPEDLGFQTIAGRRTHGVAMQLTTIGGRTIRVESWLDVDNARLIARKSYNSSDDTQNLLRTFDWRQPNVVVIPPDQQAAPCSEAFYNLAPSARPSPSATAEAQASATPAGTP